MKDSQRKAIHAKLKNGSEIVYSGKHTLLSTKLPDDRSGQGSSVGLHSLKPNERITYVVAKADDGSMFDIIIPTFSLDNSDQPHSVH